jgi:hypothetical protein
MKELVRSCALATLLSLAGCASPPTREALSARDMVTSLRASLATMSDDESAPAARVELERARAWLSEAEATIGKEGEAPEKVDILVELSRGQLLLVKSILERRKAEQALAQKSAEYKKERDSLETIQRNTRAMAPAPAAAPEEEEP